jgi:hypothetical protein
LIGRYASGICDGAVQKIERGDEGAKLSNGPSSAELQGDEIVELLKFMKDNGRSRLESSDQADKAWRERIDQYVKNDPVRTG